jgi:GGDEF domain-containing protein
MGLARKLGAKGTAAAVAASLAAEPAVGTVQENLDRKMVEGGVPGPVRFGVNLATGVAVGGLTEAALRGGTKAAVRGVGQAAKSDFVSGLARNRFGLEAGEDVVQKGKTKGEPPVPAGMTRLYHGSAQHGRYEGPAWFSSNREYAKNYREGAELQYVDVPTDFVNSRLDPDNYGQTVEKGFTLNIELDSGFTGRRKPIPGLEAGEEVAEAAPKAVEPQATAPAPIDYGAVGPRDDFPIPRAFSDEVADDVLSVVQNVDEASRNAFRQKYFDGHAFDNGMPGFLRRDMFFGDKARGLKGYGEAAFEYANKNDVSTPMAHFDIGHMAGMNSTFGDHETNKILVELTGIIRKTYADHGVTPVVGRIGGDEMASIAPGVSQEVFDTATKAAKVNVEQFAKDRGLLNLTAKKKLKDGTEIEITKDVTLHTATGNLNGFKSWEDARVYIDSKREANDVIPRNDREAGAFAPGGQAGRVEGGDVKNQQPLGGRAAGEPGISPAAEAAVATPGPAGAPGRVGDQAAAVGDTTLFSNPIPQAWKALTSAYVKNIGSPIWDGIVQKALPNLLEKIPGGKAVNRALIYGYRGDLPNAGKFNRATEDMRLGQSLGTDYAVDLGRRLQDVPEDAQLRLGEFIRGEIEYLHDPALQRLGDEASQALYSLGRQAVDAGLLSEETFFRNAGRYMPRLYTSKEYQALLGRFNITKPNRLDLDRFRARKDIPKEIREEMGEILTPGYPVAKGIAQLTHDIEMSKFFSGVASNAEWVRVPQKSLKGGRVEYEAAGIPEGWKQLSENKRLGKLSGAYVHPEIYDELDDVVKTASKGEQAWNKALGMWKFGKVILSPKTHVRNNLSNALLAHLGGMPLLKQPYYLGKAAKEMRAGGEYWKMAKQEGLLDSTFTQRDLRPLFDQVTMQMDGTAGGSAEAVGLIGRAVTSLRGAAGKASDLYQAEEQWFKLAKFVHNIESRGMPAAEAAADAEKWLFNYGKLTRFQDKYRRKWYGAPFATFTFKAMPRVMEAAVKYPWRFAVPLLALKGLETAAMDKIGDTPGQAAAKKELRPEWMQGETFGVSNFTRIPVVDDDGREYYLNLTYILPWGDIGEGGGFGPIPGSLMPMSQPFVKEIGQQVFNYDNFWDEQIVKPEDTAGKSPMDANLTEAKLRGQHLFNTMAPTPALDVLKGIDAMKGTPDYRGRFRDPGTVAADAFLGVKTYPVDYNEQIVRFIAESDPQRGQVAKKIQTEIKTLAVKKSAVEKRGGNTEPYQKLIDEKIEQLRGMAETVRKIGDTTRRLRGE